MKYVRFVHDGTIRFGLVERGVVRFLTGEAFTGGVQTGESAALSAVRLLAPVAPRTVVAVGLNYADHAKESGMEVPREPMLFLKTPGTIIGPGDSIRLVVPEHRNDYEAELVVVIGREARNVAADEAGKYVFGYTCGNDVSDRTYQKSDSQWVRAKACDTYGPIGPVVTDEVDPHNLRIVTRVNGETRQNSNTDQMVFGVPALIAHVTRYVTLLPGDVIFTGTPPGIGPIRAGDTVEIEIEGIGVLTNPVANA